MVLDKKNAVIYGGGGAIGSAVAKAFAAAGANVHLVGRTKETLDAVAGEITAAGGNASVAVVDATDEAAVEAHVKSVVADAGTLDISLNLVTRGDVQGVPLLDLPTKDVVGPVATGLTANFVTARAAARQMVEQGSGVILALNSGSAHGSPMMGATGPADAAIDAFVRNLAAEIGPRGVRVLGVWTAGLPETLSREKLATFSGGVMMEEEAFQGILQNLDQMRMTRRSPRLSEVAATLTFLASDHAAAITGTFVNATSGMFPS
ncbi:Enoyl-[acyl-carrier-protein] reductase [NADH] [Streptoalloteichus tenebrarius]|uniref:Enoyl-[acyl-carrier-protein] reductase [NADH] n=2 Tax=Streptoalloteichus tenebrarius (strain ATCC 17920 / DSM 40477 / JCM 4838 / CBS 697.72 / NBRC 16177 / NCIMB 11028 / NRRL B-12390 / A12253. 1 / ISP 5477) TaxID=1933 RepID=A0ABT1HLV0_STRSD|nr:Enoyl-[acyl-carrier-protein] reductase [NADH] [Streptoalloteichus tenebrarius]